MLGKPQPIVARVLLLAGAWSAIYILTVKRFNLLLDLALHDARSKNMNGTNTTNLSLSLLSVSVVRSPRLQIGGWIGNHWIPPVGWKQYSIQELQEFYSDKSILWIGDSTARRTSLTMYAILNSSASASQISVADINNPAVIDVGVGRYSNAEPCTQWPELSTHTVPRTTTDFHNGTSRATTTYVNRTFRGPPYCRSMPHSRDPSKQAFRSVTIICMDGLIDLVRLELERKLNYTSGINLIVISLGIWHADRPGDCDRSRPLEDQIEEAIRLLDRLQTERPELTILWRTSGFSTKPTSLTDDVRMMNEKVMTLLDGYTANYTARNMIHRMSYVDWASAVEPRSWGRDRIAGDIPCHYGLEARLVLVQMVTNRLHDMQQQQAGINISKVQ